jgi:hypothetical protein
MIRQRTSTSLPVIKQNSTDDDANNDSDNDNIDHSTSHTTSTSPSSTPQLIAGYKQATTATIRSPIAASSATSNHHQDSDSDSASSNTSTMRHSADADAAITYRTYLCGRHWKPTRHLPNIELPKSIKKFMRKTATAINDYGNHTFSKYTQHRVTQHDDDSHTFMSCSQ